MKNDGVVTSADGVFLAGAGLRTGGLAQVDMDALDLGVELQAVHAQLTANAALLVAAEGAEDAGRAAAVDAHHAGPDTLGDPERLVDVPRPDRAIARGSPSHREVVPVQLDE